MDAHITISKTVVCLIQQKHLQELHVALSSNMVAVHQMTNEANGNQDINQQLQVMCLIIKNHQFSK